MKMDMKVPTSNVSTNLDDIKKISVPQNAENKARRLYF
jgi:hypothetical protein